MVFLEKCIQFILNELEGGDKVVRDPNDSGGTTKFGISQRNNPEVSVEDLSLQDAMKIVKEKYAVPIKFNEVCKINPNLALFFLDCSIHSGPAQSIKLMQRLCRTKADGVMGPKTIRAIKSKNFNRDFATEFLTARFSHLTKLKAFSTYRNGWTRRILILSSKTINNF